MFEDVDLKSRDAVWAMPGTAVISGGSSGIGLATAELLLERGAKVHLVSREERGIAQLRERHEGVSWHQLDVTDHAAIAELALQLGDEPIHYLVANAGTAVVAPSEDLAAFEYQRKVNCDAAISIFEALRPQVQPGGAAVFVSTFLRTISFPGLASYIATKAALSAWVRTRAVELAASDIRLNLVSPGPTDTPIWGNAGLPDDVLPQVAKQIEGRMLTGRFLRPDEIAQVVCFLLSPTSSGVWGQDCVVDGGYTLQ